MSPLELGKPSRPVQSDLGLPVNLIPIGIWVASLPVDQKAVFWLVF